VSESLLRSVMGRMRQVDCLGDSYFSLFPWDSLLGSGWWFLHAWEGLSFQCCARRQCPAASEVVERDFGFQIYNGSISSLRPAT